MWMVQRTIGTLAAVEWPKWTISEFDHDVWRVVIPVWIQQVRYAHTRPVKLRLETTGLHG